jgi:6-pyruvoyltetrahydropterin/6-carboxytetrahydropterin synthase
MYTLAVRRDFIARHYLIGGDWGPENNPNSHHFVLEVELEGSELDSHGYLVDIVDIEKELSALLDYYKEQMLNDLPEFRGLNPSLENFVRILALSLSGRITTKSITALKLTLWETQSAWASYSLERKAT